MRRSVRCAVANMERGPRGRRLPSAYPRRGVLALLSAHPGNEKPSQAPAEAPSTPTRQAKASGKRGDARESLAPCRGSSSVNRAARRRAHRSRGKRDAPLRAALREDERLREPLCGRQESSSDQSASPTLTRTGQPLFEICASYWWLPTVWPAVNSWAISR